MFLKTQKKKDILFVSIQLLLFVIYLFRIKLIDFHIAESIRYAGLIITCAGFVFIISAIISLKKNLTPFPSPKKESRLITTGLYHFVRHPIYTGISMFTSGYGLYSENSLRIIIAFALFTLFVQKAKYEEAMLADKFQEYKNYQASTAALLPWIY